MKTSRMTLFAIIGAAVAIAGCRSIDTSIFGGSFGRNSSAMTAGGAVAGQDYVIGLRPSEAAQQHFASTSLSSEGAPVTVTPGDDKGTGVVWTDDGGIVIPPGTTIEFTNKGCCLDPHLPAPKADEEMQFIKTSCLIPTELQGTYKNLLRRAAAGDEEVKSNLQHLMWTLRTAGSNDAYAKNLTDRQREILAECADGGSFDGYCQDLQRFDGLKKLVKDQVSQVAEQLQIEVGNVTYKASDLLDPEIGKQKVAAHLGELIHMNEYLPVVQSGFNYGELEKGIYTDIKGNGTLSFKAKVANSTSEPFVFYPMDYVAQVGSGQNMQGAFFAAADSTMRQRTTATTPEKVEAAGDGTSKDEGTTTQNWDDLPCSIKRNLLRNSGVALDVYNDLSSYNKDGIHSASSNEVGGREFAEKFSALMKEYYESQNDGTDRLVAGLYKDDVSGKTILAFRGSDHWADWKYDNLALATGNTSSQVEYARKIVGLLSEYCECFDVVGHSLGGYLAVVSTIGQSDHVSNIYTYNAPGVHSAVLSHYGDSSDVSSKAFNLWHTRDPAHLINDHVGRQIEMSNYAGLGDWFVSQLPTRANNIYQHSMKILKDRIANNMAGCGP